MVIAIYTEDIGYTGNTALRYSQLYTYKSCYS